MAGYRCLHKYRLPVFSATIAAPRFLFIGQLLHITNGHIDLAQYFHRDCTLMVTSPAAEAATGWIIRIPPSQKAVAHMDARCR